MIANGNFYHFSDETSEKAEGGLSLDGASLPSIMAHAHAHHKNKDLVFAIDELHNHRLFVEAESSDSYAKWLAALELAIEQTAKPTVGINLVTAPDSIRCDAALQVAQVRNSTSGSYIVMKLKTDADWGLVVVSIAALTNASDIDGLPSNEGRYVVANFGLGEQLVFIVWCGDTAQPEITKNYTDAAHSVMARLGFKHNHPIISASSLHDLTDEAITAKLKGEKL